MGSGCPCLSTGVRCVPEIGPFDYPQNLPRRSAMRNWTLCIIGSLLITGLYAAAPQTSGGNKNEQEIRALEERFATAFCAKDVTAIMKNYAPGNELFVFDVSVPRQYVGFDAYKKDWEDFFATFPGPVDKF